MTTGNTVPGRRSPVGDLGTPPAQPESQAPASPSWPWRSGALVLAAAAQLITISALTSADPLAVTWSSLLLAIAPAPLTAAAVVVLIAGIVGGILHTWLFFLPALVVLAVGTVRLWQEQP